MPLSSMQWSQVESLVGELLELSSEERRPHLQGIADPSVRAEVEALLAAADTPSPFLSQPATVVAKDAVLESLAPGTRIGPWLVLRLVGRGGAGEVYEARRDDGQFEQRAAVKLLHQESAPLLDRFNLERQILARLDHPGIARLLDGGVTESGRPYAVMEYIEGQTLTSYCRAHSAGLVERLRLFVQVCDAVAYAHRNLIVHRDLKPTNILVGGDARVRLLDFGIAKLLDPASWPGRESAQTQSVFTPDYAAPEQLAGEPITTATDVHALGLLLFELLTGRRAWTVSGKPLATALRTLLDAPVPLVSRTAAEEKEPPVSPSLLRGDLDAIVSKCLRKEPAQRYPSVDALRLDVERSMRGETVSARSGERLYAVGRFIRRHRAGVALAAGVVLLLIAFAGTLAIQLRAVSRERDRASREAEASQRVSQFMVDMFKVSSPSEARGNSVTAREILDKASKQIESGLSRDPVVQARLMDTMAQVYNSLGLFAKALPLAEKAVGLRQKLLGSEHLDTLRSMDLLANTRRLHGQNALAEREHQQVLAIRIRVLGPEHPDTLLSMNNLANVQLELGKYREAASVHRQVLEIRRRILGPEHPQTQNSINNLANTEARQGHYAEAAGLNQQLVDIRRRTLGPEHPDTLRSMHNLATDQRLLGQYSEAEKLDREVLEARRRILGAEHPDVLHPMMGLATIYFARKQFADAEKMWQQVYELARRLLGAEHPQTLPWMAGLAEAKSALGQHAAAEKLLLEALAIEARVLGPEHYDTLMTKQILAHVRARQGRDGESEKLLVETLATARRVFGETHPLVGRNLYYLGTLALRRGDRKKAIDFLSQAINSGISPDDAMGMSDDDELKELRGEPEFEALVNRTKEPGLSTLGCR